MSLATLENRASLRFRSAARTHAGGHRSVNEDRLLDRPADGLWAVADGMGGQRAGDVAAARLVDALARVQHGASGYACLADIVREVDAVNASLFAEETQLASLSGATLVALLVHEGYYACLWAGDSRAYLFRDGALTLLTHDHSLVQEMVDKGVLTQAESRTHPSINVVTRAVGAGPTIELERRFAPLADGDVFLLCSDGLTSCLGEQEIEGALRRCGGEPAADVLLEAALVREPRDNVSFILIEMTPL